MDENKTESVSCETSIAVKPETGINFPSNSIFNPETYERAFTLARIYASSNIAPQSYRGKPNDCFVAVTIAMRMGIDPIMVMQSSDVISGNFSWRGSACYALIEACGKFKCLHYVETWKNKDDFSCKLVATNKETGLEVESDTINPEMVKAMGWADKAGSHWNKMPRQMARYRSAAFFARAHCPEALMGLYTTDEQADIHQIYDEIEEEE